MLGPQFSLLLLKIDQIHEDFLFDSCFEAAFEVAALTASVKAKLTSQRFRTWMRAEDPDDPGMPQCSMSNTAPLPAWGANRAHRVSVRHKPKAGTFPAL
jgi:hypothetical protein